MARRGRKKKPGAPRHPNGKISAQRSYRRRVEGETEVAVQSVALSARKRLHGLPDELLKDQRAGSVVGLLALDPRIPEKERLTLDQYNAALKYLAVRNHALVAMDAPDVPREPKAEGIRVYTGCGCIGECRGQVSPHPCDRRSAQAAMDRYIDAQSVVWQAQGRIAAKADALLNECRLEDAVSVIVVGDQAAPELELALRHALNALAAHFFVGRVKAVA